MKDSFSIAILGPGAVGGFLACVLSKNNVKVTCIAREETSELIQKNGIKLESNKFGSFRVYPRAIAYLSDAPDVLFITTKATTLNEAIRRIHPACIADTVIIPLLNGVEHLEILRAVFNTSVVAGSMGNVELKRVSPVHVVHSTPSVTIELSDQDHKSSQRVREIAEFLSQIGITTHTQKNELEVLWRKLVRLNAIACTTSAADKPIGFICADLWWRKQLTGCVEEACKVAQCKGVYVNPQEVEAHIEDLPVSLETSMQRDIRAGRPSEVDAIAGGILRTARDFGIDCPTIALMMGMIKSTRVIDEIVSQVL